jgi:hypothetical protein
MAWECEQGGGGVGSARRGTGGLNWGVVMRLSCVFVCVCVCVCVRMPKGREQI